MFKEASTSVSTGVAPASRTPSTVATKVKLWVMISSPPLIPRAAIATRTAADPEETPRA